MTRSDNKYVVGISTGMLFDKHQLEALLSVEPSIVEFYNYPSSSLEQIRFFCTANNLRRSFHVPTPYDGEKPLSYFRPTGPDATEVRRAIEHTLNTLRAAADLNAEYIVVHFPSPYPTQPEEVGLDAIMRFFDPVCAYALRLGLVVMVENMSSHPSFYLPSHYKQIFEHYSNTKLCLDFSHAHILQPATSLMDFIDQVGKFIGACHVNNSTILRYGRFKGEMPSAGHGSGYADIQLALDAIFHRSESERVYLIVEGNDRIDTAENQANFNWMKSLAFKYEQNPRRS
jgi:sugar phosphate isomerase/epimerase